MATVAEVITAALREARVEYVFGLPGGENIELIEALRRGGVRFILTHHETAAAFMADACARLTRRPSVCLATLGPGAVNLIPGIAHAYLDRSPVVALTAQMSPDLYAQHSHQRLDLHALFGPITKLSASLRAEGAGTVVEEALRVAQEGRPGPVHLELPANVAIQTALPRKRSEGQGMSLVEKHKGVEIDPEALRALQMAEYPAIVVGLGMEPEGPYEELRRLAEQLEAPVIVTPKAKGAIPEDHPLYAGVIGLIQKEAPFELLNRADLVIAIGLDPVELLLPWTVEQPTLRIDTVLDGDAVIPAQWKFHGNICVALEQLCAIKKTHSRWTEHDIQRVCPAWPQEEGEELLPYQVVRAAREALPRGGIATCDVGSHKLLVGKLWPAYTPNSFLVSNGLSIMGYAFPAAIAAKLADPGRGVVCLTGDGGFAMMMHELETCVRLGLSLAVVIFADGAFSLIRLKQTRAGYPPTGTEFLLTDFTKLAESFGARGILVETAVECREAVSAALQAPGLTLIEARISPTAYQEY